MILIDSSAWIEFYRKDGLTEIKKTVKNAIKEDKAVINGIIHVEILAFASKAEDYENIDSDFSSFHWFDLGKHEFTLAASIGKELREKGITIPATDLIIAASAQTSNASLLHYDRHFEIIASCCNFSTISPLHQGK